MSKVLIEEQTLYDIGDAIREKNGSETTYKPSEMPDAIESIPLADYTGLAIIPHAGGIVTNGHLYRPNEASNFFRIPFIRGTNSYSTSTTIDWSKDFTIHIRFLFDYAHDVHNETHVLCGSTSKSYMYTPSIELANNAAGVSFLVSYDGNNWSNGCYIDDSTVMTDIRSNTWADVDMSTTGSTLTCMVSTDNGHSATATSTLSDPVYYNASNAQYGMTLGGMMNNSNKRFGPNSFIDLGETYISTEGRIAFGVGATYT